MSEICNVLSSEPIEVYFTQETNNLSIFMKRQIKYTSVLDIEYQATK